MVKKTRQTSHGTIGQPELARLAGVSQKTVSLALRGRPGVNQRTGEKIRRLARQHGYRFNTAAHTMLRGRHDTLSLVMSVYRYRSLLPEELLLGIDSACREHGQHLLINRISDEKLTDAEYVPRILREWHSDGLLINYNADIPPRMIDLVEEYAVPAVWMNFSRPHDAVHPDDHGAGEQAARHLLELGHTRITYVDFNSPAESKPAHYSAGARQAGYEKALQDAGFEPRRVGETRTRGRRGGTLDLLKRELAREQRPTAFVCYSAFEARAVIAAALVSGLRVPEDVSVICFAALRPLDELGVRPTVFVLPLQEVGQRAVDMLMRKIADPGHIEPTQRVPFQLQQGQSTAPPAVRRPRRG